MRRGPKRERSLEIRLGERVAFDHADEERQTWASEVGATQTAYPPLRTPGAPSIANIQAAVTL